MLIGYARVSTAGQKLDRQDLGDVDRLFEDTASGATRERPELDAMLRFARDGDTVRVWSMDRLGRSLVDLMTLVNDLTADGVTVEFVSERLTFRPGSENPYDTLVFQIFGAVAQFERAIIKQRQAEGIAKAKEAGKYAGRTPALAVEHIAPIREHRATGVPIARLARDYGVSRGTIHAALAGSGVYA